MLGAAGAALAVLAVFGRDRLGLLLAGGAGALLILVALRDLLLTPRLSAGEGGITVRSMMRRVYIPWEMVRIKVRVGRRYGLQTKALELESLEDETQLLVLGRRDLGADPELVGVELLRQMRPLA